MARKTNGEQSIEKILEVQEYARKELRSMGFEGVKSMVDVAKKLGVPDVDKYLILENHGLVINNIVNAVAGAIADKLKAGDMSAEEIRKLIDNA